MLETLLAALLIVATSLLGVIFIYNIWREKLDAHLSYLVSFSAGVFLVTGAFVIYEANHAGLPWLQVFALALLGYLLAFGLHRFWPDTHHHHEDEHCERHQRPETARKLLVGDGVHNIADGIMLAVTFMVSPVLGITAAISIAIHEVLQTVSIFFVFRHAGYSARRAFVLNALVATTIFFGVFVGYFMSVFSSLELWLLALSGGFFLHVVAHDLFPKHKHHVSNSHFLKHLFLTFIGVILMLSVQLFLSDGHTHSHEVGHSHQHDEGTHSHSYEEDEYLHSYDHEDEHHH